MRVFSKVPWALIIASLTWAALVISGAGEKAQSFACSGSQVSFEASTNVPGIDVAGKSKALIATVEVAREGSNLVLKHIDAMVAVQSLSTGMNLRDEHMRKHIFTTSDGRMPDVHFVASDGRCEGKTCRIAGEMSIRGVSHPLSVALTLKDVNAESLAAKGDATLMLSDFGIEAPSQLGVKTSNEVKIHLELALSLKAQQR